MLKKEDSIKCREKKGLVCVGAFGEDLRPEHLKYKRYRKMLALEKTPPSVNELKNPLLAKTAKDSVSFSLIAMLPLRRQKR